MTPVLWHIKISHYNEKARWALDYKGVAHKRRAPLPLFGSLPVALLMTGKPTFPVLRLDGKAIGDSTRIIAALEERYPEPPLYPADPGERERALALEDFFDEQLAPAVRRVVWGGLAHEPRLFVDASMGDSPRAVRAALKPSAPLTARIVLKRYGATPETTARAREQVVAAMERVQAELRPSGYLAGDAFSVADLAAAALFTPLIGPPERQYLPPIDAPPRLQAFRDELAAMPGAEWVREMFRRHRGVSAEVGARA